MSELLYCVFCGDRIVRDPGEQPCCAECLYLRKFVMPDLLGPKGTKYCEKCCTRLVDIVTTESMGDKCKCGRYKSCQCREWGCNTWTATKNDRLWWCKKHTKATT